MERQGIYWEIRKYFPKDIQKIILEYLQKSSEKTIKRLRRCMAELAVGTSYAHRNNIISCKRILYEITSNDVISYIHRFVPLLSNRDITDVLNQTHLSKEYATEPYFDALDYKYGWYNEDGRWYTSRHTLTDVCVSDVKKISDKYPKMWINLPTITAVFEKECEERMFDEIVSNIEKSTEMKNKYISRERASSV